MELDEIKKEFIKLKGIILMALEAECVDDPNPGVLVSALGSIACDVIKLSSSDQDTMNMKMELFIKTIRDDLRRQAHGL